VQRFLSHLAVERSVSAKTQGLAYNAVAFLFKHVLERPLENVRFARSKWQQRLPVVLTREEMRRLCEAMALTRKYPNTPREWIWPYVFPSSRLAQDPKSGEVRRHHLHRPGVVPVRSPLDAW
jgi:hypothetical protein